MLNKRAENTVFKRYNMAVAVAFVVIVIVALTAATLRYYSELTIHKENGLASLNAQARQLNAMLVQSEQAITGIQEFAHYALEYPENLNKALPQFIQNKQQFYLNVPRNNKLRKDQIIRGNITGIGDINKFSLLKKQEISMANALTPAFVAAQNIIEEATWFYYVSAERFVNIYPWIDRQNWQFSDRVLNNAHAQKIKQLKGSNKQVVWSSPYIDAAGAGMNASLGIGVYRNDNMLGSIVIDINLARLHNSLPELESAEQGLVLFNQNNDILIFKQQGKDPLSYRASWSKLLPEALRHLDSQKLGYLDNSVHIDKWLVEQQSLLVNGWVLLKYQPYSEFISPLRDHFIFMFAILLIGLLAFLMLVNAMTRRSFIKPTIEFIRHIEYCAQGDPGMVKPAADWLHWFVLVEDIFTQNRSLLLQLKEQNEVLDSRVLEKTHALQETSIKHQRDYVLLRSVMNAIPELIIFSDPQGKLMGCNQAFEQLCGHSESSMLGQQAKIFMPKALAYEIAILNKELADVFPQQVLIEAGEYSYQGFCNQFTNEQAEVLGTITILQDVTEQQATQSALEKAKNQAEYANQVKIQFLANMSHEIRTPINAMQGMMDLLTRTLLSSTQQHYLENAQTAAFSLLHLIDELLDLSKIEAGKMLINKDEVNLPQVIDKALKLNVGNVHIQNLNLRVELAENVPTLIKTDEMRLVQVLSNLLNNAIKFTEQGEVLLTIDTIGLSDNNALVRFKVKDTGIGIAKNKQGHLFEAFAQADISMTRKYGGSGLGLSICQQIVKLLGGEITLKSTLGQGSEFSFILPFSIIPKAEQQYDNGLSNLVNICVIGQSFPTSFIDTIKSFGWHYWQFDDLLTLEQHLSTDKSLNENVVLLIDEAELLKQITSLEDAHDNWSKSINLIGLCQPAILELSTETYQQLDNISTPFVLLDTPIYRYALDQIGKILTAAAKLPQTKVSDNKTQPQVALSTVVSSNKSTNKTAEFDGDLNNIKVLLVEDNLVNQLVAKELLASLNAIVTIADNGKQAIDTLEKHAENNFDVVLMDIQMPIMDGLTATQKIREQNKYQHLPIIAMTAHAMEEDKQRSIAVGMNGHIAKPVTSTLLFTSISPLLIKANLNS